MDVADEFEDCTGATLVPNRSTHLYQFHPDSLYRSARRRRLDGRTLSELLEAAAPDALIVRFGAAAGRESGSGGIRTPGRLPVSRFQGETGEQEAREPLTSGNA
jgi:hypothetical protein